jgi:uncharacterized protein YegL
MNPVSGWLYRRRLAKLERGMKAAMSKAYQDAYARAMREPSIIRGEPMPNDVERERAHRTV